MDKESIKVGVGVTAIVIGIFFACIAAIMVFFYVGPLVFRNLNDDYCVKAFGKDWKAIKDVMYDDKTIVCGNGQGDVKTIKSE